MVSFANSKLPLWLADNSAIMNVFLLEKSNDPIFILMSLYFFYGHSADGATGGCARGMGYWQDREAGAEQPTETEERTLPHMGDGSASRERERTEEGATANRGASAEAEAERGRGRSQLAGSSFCFDVANRASTGVAIFRLVVGVTCSNTENTSCYHEVESSGAFR